jgi:predicted nucleic acid-binding protein
MKKVFADAGYWIALFNPRDRLHDKAVLVAKTLGNTKIVTSQIVLLEFLNHYASSGSHFRRGAVKVVKNLQKNTQIEIVAQTSDQFETALALYAQRLDKSWGLSDCISFQIMQSQGIVEALAYDEHFAQAGFMPLLRD